MSSKKLQYSSQFLSFVNASPSPFHAVESVTTLLTSAGFHEIKETTPWDASILKKGQSYFFKRNQSAVIAFSIGGQYEPGNGFSILGAHTDSPCLRVKPKSKREKVGYDQVGVETYGGGLWHTWFDRDLSLAGKVLVSSNSGIAQKLVNLEKPILRIPTLAIHLDRSVGDGFKFNNENQLTPILAITAEKILNAPKAVDEGPNAAAHHISLLKMMARKLNVNVNDIGEFELCLYDTQPAALGGINEEFIFSARLDNLMMSFCSTIGLIEASSSLGDDKTIRVVGLFDNEEVGSLTAHGANSNLLESTLRRLSNLSFGKTLPLDIFDISMANSFFISADMAHSIHPNYSEKHEDNHRPLMNKGVVIKENANQRYATTSISTTILREIAKVANVTLQDFVVRNDSPCGSTIGPMLSAKLGVRTIDVGNPQLSMHSIREQCGSEDTEHAVLLFKAFFEHYFAINKSLI